MYWLGWTNAVWDRCKKQGLSAHKYCHLRRLALCKRRKKSLSKCLGRQKKCIVQSTTFVWLVDYFRVINMIQISPTVMVSFYVLVVRKHCFIDINAIFFLLKKILFSDTKICFQMMWTEPNGMLTTESTKPLIVNWRFVVYQLMFLVVSARVHLNLVHHPFKLFYIIFIPVECSFFR